ncbi:MAG: methyl-accepting chemotaxis protein [bacterium]|nr:methyl-accepting chemotaxis protein [bacterium]
MDFIETIESITQTIQDITDTAQDVNKQSHTRKGITSDSLALIEKLIDGNGVLKANFEKIYQNLNDSLMGIASNSDEFRSNVEHFSVIISYINDIKDILGKLEEEIDKLTAIVDEIKNDTDEIFTLALNASIVSSKYSHTSGVFDILANKLNEMSNFINQNLESIVKVVKPITDGISKMIFKNAMVLGDIEKGYNSFTEFPTTLDKQKESIDELVLKAYLSGTKIDDQKKMLHDINQKVDQMDKDAHGAIDGSRNVMNVGEDLRNLVDDVMRSFNEGGRYQDDVETVGFQSTSIWQSAQKVNEKSRSQLEFSLSCVDFCDSLISESNELKKTTEIFNQQSIDNNSMANTISQNLVELTAQLKDIENKIGDSNSTIKKFNDDYKQIDNILEFLKNILKSMNIIGMLSRIESARDPEEFSGFMTISENISKLQNHIQVNLPQIEHNINMTHELIENVNAYFENISSVFLTISKSSNVIIQKLEDITTISSDSKIVSQSILDESNKIDALLTELRNYLMQLTEVVKKPIEGSAANIERGKKIESQCQEIMGSIQKDEEPEPAMET